MRAPIIATVLPLLLPLAAAAPARAEDLGRDLTVEQSTAANAVVSQSGGLKVSLNSDRPDATYAKGETARLFLSANESAYVTVLNIGPAGQVTQLFPNAFQPSGHVPARC